MNFKLDKITAPHVNKVAEAMANDVNYGTKTVRTVLDEISRNFTPEFASWVMDKAFALNFGN